MVADSDTLEPRAFAAETARFVRMLEFHAAVVAMLQHGATQHNESALPDPAAEAALQDTGCQPEARAATRRTTSAIAGGASESSMAASCGDALQACSRPK